jgi:hypothetical protein
MAEFLELIESIRSEEASVGKLFGDAGKSVRSGGRLRATDPGYASKLAEAAKFVAEVMTGKRPAHYLREALGTGDFPYLFGDIIDRQLLANYLETPATYRSWCRVATVADFRAVKRFAINGSESVLATVGQQEEYPESKISDIQYTYAVSKYGRAIPFAWEAMVNDDLDALKDIPARFGKAARRTEEKFATGLMFDANGPNASVYTGGNKNQVIVANGALTANPPLSIAGLQDGFTVLLAMKDTDGEPITVDAVELVVPPALMVTAENILNATELWLNPADTGAASQSVHTVNWMKQRVHLNVDYYIPIIATAGTTGSKSWVLVANPGSQRPAFEMGFLRGHTEPEVFLKDPNAIRVGGGGVVNPLDGDFDTDSLRYKVRHVVGGVAEDYRMTVASNGSGS